MSSYLFPLIYSLYTSPLGWYLNHYLLNPTDPAAPPHSTIDPATNTVSAGNVVITPIPYGKDNYAYALHHRATHTAVLVDAGDAAAVQAWCKANNVARVTHVLSTHKHHDHTGGNFAVVRQWPACVVVGGVGEGVACVTREVKGGDTLAGLLEGAVDVEVVSAPGHTRGSVMYLVTCGEATVALFSGDAVFRAGVGKFFELGAPNVLGVIDDLERRKLPASALLFPGHEYALANLHFARRVMPDNAQVREALDRVKELRRENKCTVPTKLADEWATNPFFRTRSETVALTHTVREVLEMGQAGEENAGQQWGPEQLMQEMRRARDEFVVPQQVE